MKDGRDNMEDNYKWREIDFTEYDNEVSETKYEKDVKFVDANIFEKVEKIGKKISFARDIRAVYIYITDGRVSWYRKTIVVSALVYFITPIDAIPDISPLIGYLDDLGVITALLKYLGSEIISYY